MVMHYYQQPSFRAQSVSFQVCQWVLKCRTSKNSLIQMTVLNLLPRLAAFRPSAFTGEETDGWMLVLLKLDWKLASSLLSRWVCAGDAAVETLCLEDEQINSSMQVVEGQVVFCLFFKAKTFLWFSEWIESYFLNSVISTLRSRTSFLSFLSSNLWLHSALLIAIRIALILSAELFSSFCYICQEISR